MDNHFEVVTKVGHDLNKYLARIKAYNYLLLSRFEKSLNEEEKSFFDGIEQECDSMYRFIHDLVIADKVRAYDEIHQKEKVFLNAFLKMLTQRYQATARIKEIELNFEESARNLCAHLHKDTFERAINNLLHNALKFTPAKGKISVRLNTCNCHKFVDIVVEDAGIGIPPSLQPYVFDKFTRAGRKGVGGEESNGLGMYITKSIVENHGGCIWFDTIENEGTVFTVRIPGTATA